MIMRLGGGRRTLGGRKREGKGRGRAGPYLIWSREGDRSKRGGECQRVYRLILMNDK